MLLTFDFSRQKFAEDVLQHVCNPKLFIQTLISHRALLARHQTQPFLLVGPSGKGRQAPSHTWRFIRREGQQEYCFIPTVAGWRCPVPAPPKLCTATLFRFISVPLRSRWSPIWTPVRRCMVGQHSTMWGIKHKFPYHLPVDLSFPPSFGNRVGVAGGQRARVKKLKAVERQKRVWRKQNPQMPYTDKN